MVSIRWFTIDVPTRVAPRLRSRPSSGAEASSAFNPCSPVRMFAQKARAAVPVPGLKRPDQVANEHDIVFAYINLHSRDSLALQSLAETVNGLALRFDHYENSKMYFR